MIASFGDAGTEDLYHGRKTKRARSFPHDVVPVALRKLDMIASAKELEDLAQPPGNRLKALKGDLKGYHSIRVNDQWRIVFKWTAGNAHEVSLQDYHY